MKRLGALEAERDAAKKKDEEVQMSALSARAAAVVDKLIAPSTPGAKPRILRRDRDLFINQGVQALKTATFGAVTGNSEGAFAAWERDLESRPAVFAEPVREKQAATQTQVDPFLLGSLGAGSFLSNENPRVVERMRLRLGVPSKN